MGDAGCGFRKLVPHSVFFFNDTATTEIYTLSLHDALPISYQRIGLLHEIHGGDPKALHPTMMQRGLVGLDVLTVAVHLTAAMLAGSHPDTPFEGECLLTMPYGSHTWGVSVGSRGR